MTARLGVILAVGLAVLLGTGGYALSLRNSPDAFEPLPHWGLYTNATWARLERAAAARRLRPASVKIVTGTSLERNRQPFALLGARTKAGRPCFAVASGTAIVRLICRIASPVVAFTERDTCAACAPMQRRRGRH